MGLKISIDHKKLVDSPYGELNSEIFDLTASDTQAFVQDIVNGNPTCYLISGYRGAGKSSFIKKLESDVRAKDSKALFVYLNFAKHEERSILLRKLIRNFHLSFRESTLFEVVSQSDDKKDSVNSFKELYERTFYEVSKNTNEKRTTKSTLIFGYKATLKDLILICTSLITTIAFITGLELTKWYNGLFIGGSIIWNIAQFISLEKKKVSEDILTDITSKNSFYDDEIAEHYIIEILKSFQNDIRPIFVLDELDKINNDELVENLINELKPIMLSGLASFIVVAGQNLYFDYYSSQTKDDGTLSSLFSKVHHVPLFSSAEFRVLFNKLVTSDLKSLTPEENQLKESYIDYLIFESKRIPRRFIIFIRQNLTWENNSAFIDIDKPIDELEIYSRILKQIENVNEAIAIREYPEQIRDYLNMQLLLKTHRILNHKHHYFTDSEIY